MATEAPSSKAEEMTVDGKHRIEGTRAFNRGVERDRCPHRPGTDAFKGWMAGWSNQNTEYRQRLQLEQTEMRYAKAS